MPGFFNSLAAGYARQSPPVPQQKALERAPYFSLAIVETLEKTGSPVVVVDNLDPLGSIETNGALMLEFLKELPKRRPQFKDREWIAIGHSCGGLYTLHALTAEPSLPIKTLVTISTPFRGLGFIENLSANLPFLSELASLINLESLMQLREHDVALAVAKLRPPKNLRIIATGGWQQACSFFSCNEASTLSWIHSITDALVSEISDGIVIWHSMIPDQKFLPFAIEPRPDLAVSLTDFGLLTCDAAIGRDVRTVFQQLTSLGHPGRLKHLLQSPFTLHTTLLKWIARETDRARKGKPAHIIAKMNALLEPQIIRALYKASQVGVKIDLIVRGPCALRPGIAGLSEHIRVRSIIGRFLEHSRIFYFLNDGDDRVFLSSADWMDRNFFRRIEVAFPVLDPILRHRIIEEGLRPYLEDNGFSS